MTATTTVKVTTEVRDEIRRRADEQGITQNDVIEASLRATARQGLDVHTLLDNIDEKWAPLMERLAQ